MFIGVDFLYTVSWITYSEHFSGSKKFDNYNKAISFIRELQDDFLDVIINLYDDDDKIIKKVR